YTFWSVNRDRQCADPNQGTTSGTCSSVPQTDYEFTKFSARFAGATPPTGPPPGGGGGSPTPPPGGGTCSAPTWDKALAYTGGQTVSYGGHTWKAKWWTQGDPPGSADVWADQGTCSGGGGSPSPPPGGGSCPAVWSAG